MEPSPRNLSQACRETSDHDVNTTPAGRRKYHRVSISGFSAAPPPSSPENNAVDSAAFSLDGAAFSPPRSLKTKPDTIGVTSRMGRLPLNRSESMHIRSHRASMPNVSILRPPTNTSICFHRASMPHVGILSPPTNTSIPFHRASMPHIGFPSPPTSDEQPLTRRRVAPMHREGSQSSFTACAGPSPECPRSPGHGLTNRIASPPNCPKDRVNRSCSCNVCGGNVNKILLENERLSLKLREQTHLVNKLKSQLASLLNWANRIGTTTNTLVVQAATQMMEKLEGAG